MTPITHEQQKRLWEEEHAKPFLFDAMNSTDPSSGVVKFWDWLQQRGPQKDLEGLECACGKGRNVIWLAQQAAVRKMHGFDFSTVAITEAIKRAAVADEETATSFKIHDATIPWPYADNTFDFALDIFASTDIESPEGRAFMRQEFLRVLKPGGYLLLYTLSTDDGFHGEMMKESPGDQKNSFYHPTTGKFEKIFDREELAALYADFTVVAEDRVEKMATFFGKAYPMKHFWMVLQKPSA
ncbi:MAG: class I SAM-dependent methyltransferase [Patescibacteria group bacterium]|jgi:SAM-dependent methyltransferase